MPPTLRSTTRIALLLIAMAAAWSVGAQTNLQTGNNTDSLFRGDSSAVTGLQYHTETPDSVLRRKVYYFHYRQSQPKIESLYHPSLSPTGIQRPDSLDGFNGNYYLGKGTIGHPHVAVFPTLDAGLDMRIIADPNTGYAKRPGNIRFYQTQTPFTRLAYHSSLNQDYMVGIAHTQNIRPGWNIAFDYRLINPEGVYTSSGAKNNYLDATTNYFSADSRVQAHGGIIWQKFTIDENGGISDDSYFTEQRQSNRAGIPVNLYSSGTVHKDFTAFGGASLSLVHQFEHYRHRDSIVPRYEGDSLVGLDTVALTDTIAARRPLAFNLGRVGFDIGYDNKKRVFADSTRWTEYSANVYWTNDIYPDHRWRNPLKLTVGLAPRMARSVIGIDTVLYRSWLNPYARAALGMGPFTLKGSGELRHSYGPTNRPDSRFEAELQFDFDSLRLTRASLRAVKQTRMPDIRLWHDYHGDLEPIVGEHYSVHFHHRDVVEFDIKANHLSHNVWYDSLLAVHVGTRDFWLYQARLTARLSVSWLHLDMQQLLQRSTDTAQMPVPLWASKNSLYVDVPVFHRTIRLQVGVDARYHTPFFAPAYQPEYGVFSHQTTDTIGGYLWFDVFINMQIKRASFYVKAGHVNAVWESSPNYFILPHYPGDKFGLFWGINWSFFD